MADSTLWRYSGSAHFSRIFKDSAARYSGVRLKLIDCIFSRKSGSSHFSFRVAEMRARTSGDGGGRLMFLCVVEWKGWGSGRIGSNEEELGLRKAEQ
jgi:hypothetical protein